MSSEFVLGFTLGLIAGGFVYFVYGLVASRKKP